MIETKFVVKSLRHLIDKDKQAIMDLIKDLTNAETYIEEKTKFD